MNDSARFHESLEGWLSIVINTMLFAAKYWAGIVTNSVAIVADAWHTLSDSLTSVVVIIGVRIASKPADREHPFGHGRAELVGSIIISAILGFVAYNFILESISKLKKVEPAQYGIIGIVVTGVSILAKEGMAQYALWAGKKTGARSLIADGWHHRSDAISSVIILAGIFVNPYFWWIDGVMGLLVACILFYAAFSIMKGSVSAIIGEKPDDVLINDIIEMSSTVYSKNVSIHHVHMHRYGKHAELTFHIYLPGDMSLETAHQIASILEKMIGKKYSMEVTVHMEPEEKPAEVADGTDVS